MSKTKNSLERFLCRMNWIKKKSANLTLGLLRLSSLRITKNKAMTKKECSLRDEWDTIKNTHNRRVRRNERKKEAERICEEIMAEELPKYDESINLYI